MKNDVIAQKYNLLNSSEYQQIKILVFYQEMKLSYFLLNQLFNNSKSKQENADYKY